ncbi:MAG: AI-2E family transporter [Gemmatimonadetes bacterium]|nr:AI-2E family transporter [Gemmatimonadota bacterium]MBK7714899.1 AI-2E family transporter [Gemmatimonadota bacterium]MBK7783959.1 AI-2E family transporter [Gemmatimonadota bacterium]MBP6670275.1 AI-2E family transporter [Gemmatimonadales bacterium]
MTGPAPGRDTLPAVLGGMMYVLLLVTLREILAPPLVLPLALLALWPLRDRPGVRVAMGIAVALTLVWGLKLYGGLLGPFLLALAVAYLLAPLVARLEQRRIGRGTAILLVALPPILGLALLAALAGPQVWDQAVTLVSALPRFATTLMSFVATLRTRLEGLPFLTAAQRDWLHTLDAQQLAALLQENADGLLRALAEWGLAFGRRLGTLLGFLGYLVVTPVVAFYLLRDWRPLLGFLEDLIPPTRRPALVAFIEEYDGSLGKFFRGQLIEATLVGILTGTGLAVLGVPSALLIGVIAGLCNLVPYIGIAISAIPALVVALTMDDPVGGLLRVGGVFLVVQFIDGSVTGPRIVGGSVGLHPVVTMLALAFGGAMLGFAGLLLAVPLAVLLKMLGSRLLVRYRQSAVYAGGTG